MKLSKIDVQLAQMCCEHDAKAQGAKGHAKIILALKTLANMGFMVVDMSTIAKVASMAPNTIPVYKGKQTQWSKMIHAGNSRSKDDTATIEDVIRELRARGENIAMLNTSTKQDVTIDDIVDVDSAATIAMMRERLKLQSETEAEETEAEETETDETNDETETDETETGDDVSVSKV